MTPHPWRLPLRSWPDPWRERWGRLANELEDEGLPWREAEQQAMERTRAAMAEPTGAGPEPAVTKPSETQHRFPLERR